MQSAHRCLSSGDGMDSMDAIAALRRDMDRELGQMQRALCDVQQAQAHLPGVETRLRAEFQQQMVRSIS